ncbi:MAG: allantoin permease [Candidatus Nanopelagicaceae bacterium]|jgi:purine-cytosine permease-like protein|nr:allantoin permease [Candidatus Nanopelagicaceae bacterium]
MPNPSFELELNSIHQIKDSERRGKASDLFWPWCGANVSVLAISYGAFFLGFGINFWQATLAAIIGTVLSFLLVGFSSLAGKKNSVPTMILSRATFGVKGNLVPGFLSYLVFVGWETVLVSTATLATGTVFERIGSLDRNSAMSLGFLVAVTLTIAGGVLGHKVIMQMQKWISLITLIATALYMVLTLDKINWDLISATDGGSVAGFVGAVIFAITGIGLGWVNGAADYSRYLPRSVKSASVVGWTIFGASLAPIVMVTYGAALAGSSQSLYESVAMDPVGAITNILPTWFLIFFALIAILGLIGGAILDLYSSGLTLVAIGAPIKRHMAAWLDAVIMLIGTIYVVWFSDNFLLPFQGFLITIGVPLAAWSAIFVCDVLFGREVSEDDLFNPFGKYRGTNWKSLGVMALATFIGYGFVTNTFASWLNWQGYFMDLIGGKDGQWGYSNVGVIFALIIGFIGRLALRSRNA